MFSHLTSLAKPPRATKTSTTSYNPLDNCLTSKNSHLSLVDEDSLRKGRKEDSQLNSELETLRQRHNVEEESSNYFTGRLRTNSAQTINSIRTSSTHTTNTNSATSPGIFQHCQKLSMQDNSGSHCTASQDFTHVNPKSTTQATMSSPRLQGRLQSISNGSFSMRRDLSQKPQVELQLQRQQHYPQTSSGHQQQLEVIKSSIPSSKQHDPPAHKRFHPRSASQNDSRSHSLADTSPPNQRRLSFIPRPVPTPLKTTSQSYDGNMHEFPKAYQSAFNSRGFIDAGDSQIQNTTPSLDLKRRSTLTLVQKRWSIVDGHSGRRQASSAAPSPRLNQGRSPYSATSPPPTSLQATPLKPRKSIKQPTSTPGVRPSRSSSSAYKFQSSRPGALSSPVMNTMSEETAGFKYNPTVLDEGTPVSPPPQIPIRKESPEELIQYLERLIGYDELRLLTHVDQLLHQCMHTFESNNNRQECQDNTNPNRRSIGNGILGRLGWKQRKGSFAHHEPLSKSKSLHRSETSREDRRATFGLLASNATRSFKYKVFGCPLEESDSFSCVTVIGGHKHLIPIVIFALVEEIYSRGMETPGFMRIAGKAERIDALAESFDHAPLNPDAINLGSEDIHVLCSLFKRYLRALPEPVMSRDLFHILWSFCVRERKSTNAGHLKATIAAAQCILRLMPTRAFSLLIYVVAFLSQIPLFPQCKFSSIGISKIFGPALFGSRTQRNPTSVERAIHALQWILENWNALTEGLLDEHFTVSFSESPNPVKPSLHSNGLLKFRSPESCNISMEIPTVEHEVYAPDEQYPEQQPTLGTADQIFIRPRQLVECRSNSSIRKSNPSAQHIVDRYEAHEKSLAVAGDLAGHLAQGISDSRDEPEIASQPPTSAPHDAFTEGLSNIIECSVETTVTMSDCAQHLNEPNPPELMSESAMSPCPIEGEEERASDSHDHQTPIEMEEKRASSSKHHVSNGKAELGASNDYQELIERQQQRMSKLTRQLVVVLNEPSVSPTESTKNMIDEVKSSEYDLDDRASKSLSTLSTSPSLQRLDSFTVDNLIQQGRLLQKAVGQETLCDCHTRKDQAERMLKKSMELIQAHQDLLTQMKSQLAELLNPDNKN
ncbi:hypothetical protein PCANC_21678 [Puccinia coronata f. sp. avenae]|uniref:Rho-GAP domain-containing protein n=1 Tax=Puccinia coronata f. sp. avenae TaxID=200324 RepID=A0A2N5UJI9_9BASI|nr:hypothetical protein PCANC_21678 [Puccinia coronata f. sp. avenae]